MARQRTASIPLGHRTTYIREGTGREIATIDARGGISTTVFANGKAERKSVQEPLLAPGTVDAPIPGWHQRMYNEAMTPEQRSKRLDDARDDEDPWKEWYRLTPLERWHESLKLWQFYLSVGGSLDPEPDPQSPFDAFLPRGSAPAYGRSGLRVLRRGRV